MIEGIYVGERYGKPTGEGMQALQLLSRQEGILLDPIYTSKAFAGLLDLVAGKRLDEDRPLIFLHTGGLPALFVDSL